MATSSSQPQPAIGIKIRERRKALGLTQAKLAERLQVSTSYVNLIEANRRRIGGRLLAALADVLAIDLEQLNGNAERRLSDDLRELTAEPLLRPLALDPHQVNELVATQPRWARALLTVYRAYLDGNEQLSALSDRVNRDPLLGDAVHQLLSQITAIRSSAELLVDADDDLEAAERRRFHRAISAESARLTDAAKVLVASFATPDSAARAAGAGAPEEVDDFIIGHNNYFPALEDAADALRRELDSGSGGSALDGALYRYLQSRGVDIQERAPADCKGLTLQNQCLYDDATKTFIVVNNAAHPTRRFQLARLAAELGANDVIAAAVDDPRLSTPEAQRRARRALSSYLAGALLLPYDAFLNAAAAARYDVEVLRQQFLASFEQICHRLVTLRRPGAEGVPFAFLRSDAAGYITKRFPLSGFPLPRYGHACPLWAVFRSFQTPDRVVRQLAEFADAGRFLLIARTVSKQGATFHEPAVLYAVMLACDTLHADATVYARGLDLAAGDSATPVGPTCRLCPRDDCRQRQEDAISWPLK